MDLVGLGGYILQHIKTFYCHMLRKQHDNFIIRRSSASDKKDFPCSLDRKFKDLHRLQIELPCHPKILYLEAIIENASCQKQEDRQSL